MAEDERWTLAELRIGVLASVSVCAELERDILELLSTKYENVAWQVAVAEDMADDPEQRELYAGLFQQVETKHASVSPSPAR